MSAAGVRGSGNQPLHQVMMVKVLRDAFRKAPDDAKVREMFERFDRAAICLNSEECTRLSRRSWESERGLVERVGLAGSM